MKKNIALISGAARGLGEVIARKLHTNGYLVAIADIDIVKATAVARSIDVKGKTAIPLALDVRNKQDFMQARDELVRKWGGLHVLINNAGKTQVTSLMDITPQDFDEMLAINLKGTFLACQVFGTYFAKCGYGRIINIASLAGQNGGSGTGGHYATAKGGVLTLTKVFARELAANGVTVNAIAPGPLDLPIINEILSPEKIKTIIDNIPIHAIGDPDFIADTVLLLASPTAKFTTGACWDINGGLYMR